MQKGLTER